MGLAGCSDNGTDSAGVISETESGQTANLTVSVDQLQQTTLFLTKVIDNRTTIIDSALTDSNSKATFDDVSYKESFSIVATLHGGDTTLSGITNSSLLKSSGMLTDTGFVEGGIGMSLGATANLQVSTSIAEFALGDTLCISGTLACGIYDEAAQDSGFIRINDVPASTSEGNGTSTGYAVYSQVEITSESSSRTDSVGWHVEPGNSVVSKDAVIEIQSAASFAMPQVSSLDSLDDKTLDSMIVPISLERFNLESGIDFCDSDCKGYTFVDSKWNLLPYYGSEASNSAPYWVTLPSMDSVTQVQLAYGYINRNAVRANSRIRYVQSVVDSGTSLGWELFADSSMALSFWFKADSGTVNDSGLIILSKIEDNMGFEIRQCGTKSMDVCTRIYNGVDTAATDTADFGKTSLLDGTLHHYSLVIHKKHLSIVVDGNVLRSTDLKFSEDFYKLEELKVSTNLENVVLYSFGDFIRKAEDKGWGRLDAWLQAFYELQKENL